MYLEPTVIVRRPVLTEKAHDEVTTEIRSGARQGQPLNRYTFEVDQRAAKPQIKAAIEELYGVKVKKVRTQIRKGEERRNRHGAFASRTWKKAVVELEAGQSIDLF